VNVLDRVQEQEMHLRDTFDSSKWRFRLPITKKIPKRRNA